MYGAGGLLDRLRRPEYTGENRCLPCTIVNLAIAAVGSVAVTALVWQATAPPTAVGLGVLAFGLSALLVYLRGYLVPGTPELTRRYLPERVLALFGKQPASPAPPTDGDLDPEAVLTDVGALEECPDGPDLCLADEFRARWYRQVDRVRDEDADRERLLDLLGVDDGEVTVREFDDAFRAYLGDRRVGTWPSQAAFHADLGAGTVLADRLDSWPALSTADRAHLLNGLRLFVDRCPACGATPELGTDEVKSCCSTHDVAAVECGECGARLFESGPMQG